MVTGVLNKVVWMLNDVVCMEEGETKDLVKKDMIFGGFSYFCILMHLLVWCSDSPCLPVLTLPELAFIFLTEKI
jgi:hypothetical protein